MEISNLVGLHGIFPLINTDGWNVTSHGSMQAAGNLPDLFLSPPLEGSGNQTTRSRVQFINSWSHKKVCPPLSYAL